MTPKDATILLGPSRIPADSEVTVFMAGSPGRKLIVVVEIRDCAN